MEQGRRQTILELHWAGHKPGAIYKLFENVKGYTRQTVYNVIRRYEAHGSTTRPRGKDRKPQKNKIRNKTFLAGLKRSIKADPSVNQSVHAKKRGVCESTISNAVRHDLGMKSRAMRKKQLLTPPQKEQRVIMSKRILNSMKDGRAKKLRFFSDEKIFKGMLKSVVLVTVFKCFFMLDCAVNAIPHNVSSLYPWLC